MPWESIGSVSASGFDEDPEWIEFCYKIALSYLQFTCGQAPEGCEVAVVATYTAMLELRAALARAGMVSPFWED